MSEMQSAFDARSRFVILWVLAETWFPVLASLATGWLIANENFAALQAMAFLSVPIAALCQMPLLRGRVERPWLWLIAALASAVIFQVVFNLVLTPLSSHFFARDGGGLAVWLPYFLLTAALAGVALGAPQAVAMGQWKLGAGGWFVIVLGASLVAGAIGGVVWVMAGLGAGGGDGGLPGAAAFVAALRQIAFGAITGVYLWTRLEQRSVDAARPVP